MVEEFWAVTINGNLYYVLANRDEKGTPVVKTVGDRTYLTCFHDSTRLQGGSNVGIVDDLAGLCLFNPDNSTLCAADQNIGNWGDHTTQLTALFLDFRRAKACLEAGKSSHWAEEWLAYSLETVLKIATGHEIFRLDPMVCERFGLQPIRQCPHCSLMVSGSLLDGHIALEHADRLTTKRQVLQ